MAKVTWAPGISTVSGALTKINKKSQHAGDEQMLLATHRTAPTTSKDCNRLFLRGLKSVTRTTAVTSDEIILRNRFAAVSRAVQERRRNLSYVATDVANFRAQKETGYKTFFQYLWHVCANQYDAQNG